MHKAKITHQFNIDILEFSEQPGEEIGMGEEVV